MKKIICLLLAAALIIPAMNISAAGDLSWDMPAGYYTQPQFPFKPFDNYYSYQNSPNFIWPAVYNASFELVLANDKELNDIAYYVKDIPVNMYTFPHTLESGKVYYWAVRYKTGGKYSAWSEARRLYIDEQAIEYTVPDISEIEGRLGSHPYFFNDEDIAKLEGIDKTDEAYINFKSSVDRYVNTNTLSEVEITRTASGYVSAMGYVTPATEIYNAGLMYFLDKDEKYKNFVISSFDKIKDFDPQETFEWDANSNTAEAIFAYKISVVYDLFYQYMTAEMRNDVIKLIERNLVRPYNYFANSGGYKGSLYSQPYDSHSWRINQCMVAALSIYKDSSLAKKLFDFHFPMEANVLNPFTYEDGASGQGVFYGSPVDYVHVALYMQRAGIFDLRKKGGLENALINYLYRWPSNWINSIGDAYNTSPQDTYQVKTLILYASANAATKEYREYAKWMLKHINNGSTQYYYAASSDYVFSNANAEVDLTAPYILPNAKYFADPGWICMYSDIKDDSKTGMIFKSSWFGSHNHSHPDQNSFVIQSDGVELARDSDYYDSYHSAFDLGWNKKTYAHNAITYDNGVGQPVNNLNAKGQITGFVNQSDFKLAGGDASMAYSSLAKADRDIIYINPETYIVIDDLASNGSKYPYEFWINTPGKISFYENKRGATITNKKAAMEVNVHYPKEITPYYMDKFRGLDLSEVEPPQSASNSTDKRLCFQTAKTEATKIVTTMDIHKTYENASPVKEKQFEDYLKLMFADGSVCYVNTSGKENIVTDEAIEFSGLAFIYNKNSYMLVKGNYAKAGEKTLIESNEIVSAAIGKEEISVSAINKDAKVKVYAGKPIKLIKQSDQRFYDIEENKQTAGVLWNYENGAVNLELYPGAYTLYTDKKELAGKEGSGIIKLTVDGNTKEIPFTGNYDVNGRLTYDYWPEEFKGVCVIEKLKNASLPGAYVGDIISVSNKICFYITGENAEIELKSLEGNKYQTEVSDDQTATEKLTALTVRATDYSEGGEGSRVVYWQRIDNNTLQDFNTPLSLITYEFDVPEDGKYDVAMSVSTLSMETSDKVLFIGGNIGIFNIPPTPAYSDLEGLRIKCSAKLKAGKNKITFLNMDSGRCIFDWIGLIKCGE